MMIRNEEYLKEKIKVLEESLESLNLEYNTLKNNKTYKRGDVFSTNFGKAILAQVDHSRCCLIVLKTGNRIKEYVSVLNICKITQEELNKMSEGSVRLIENHIF